MEKVNTFYQEKKAEAMRKFNTLKEQLSVTEEPNMRNNQVKKKQRKNIELLTENGAVFKMAQNTFNIEWCRLPVALGL